MPTVENASEIAVIGLVLWTLFLLASLASYRSLQTVTAGRDANSFTPTGNDLGPFGQRLTRAHANAYEFIPAALAVLVLAIATGQTAATDDLALWLLAFRVGQSLVHIASTSVVAVLIRFTAFFIPQMVIVGFWCFQLI
jgi:uncharacterized MAPEG superfamily protein